MSDVNDYSKRDTKELARSVVAIKGWIVEEKKRDPKWQGLAETRVVEEMEAEIKKRAEAPCTCPMLR